MEAGRSSITFVYSRSHQRAALAPVVQEAQRQGYDTRLTTDRNIVSDVGVFSSPRHYSRDASVDLSVIMFHGIDQGYSDDHWPEADWSRFDIGLLPGVISVKNWRAKSDWPQARPRMGIFEVGWPKSDVLFSDAFNQDIQQLREELGLFGDTTVLYAPTRENHGKMHEFVESALPVADDLLIKHAPYEDGEYMDGETLAEAYGRYEEVEHVHFLPTDLDIFNALAVADVLVSDESSVLQEAALTSTIPISVTDWPIKDSSGSSLSYQQVPSFAIKTSRSELQATIEATLDQAEKLRGDLEAELEQHYSNLGTSAELTVDVIGAALRKESFPVTPLSPKSVNPVRYQWRWARLQLNHAQLALAESIIRHMPDNVKRILQRLQIDRFYMMIPKKFRPYGGD